MKASSATVVEAMFVDLESLTQVTPSSVRTSSRRCSTPANVRSASVDGRRVDAGGQRRGGGGGGVPRVVRAAQADLGELDEPLALPPERAVAQREIVAGLAADDDAPRRSRRRRRAARAGRPRLWLGPLVLEQAQLGGAVGLERAVPGEVVGRQVQDHARPRARTRPRRAAGSELASQTTVAPAGRPSTSAVTGVPTLPASATSRPAARQIAPSSSTVVVFPFVPVTATNGRSSSRQPSSSSPQTGTPRLRPRGRSPAAAAARQGS